MLEHVWCQKRSSAKSNRSEIDSKLKIKIKIEIKPSKICGDAYKARKGHQQYPMYLNKVAETTKIVKDHYTVSFGSIFIPLIILCSDIYIIYDHILDCRCYQTICIQLFPGSSGSLVEHGLAGGLRQAGPSRRFSILDP